MSPREVVDVWLHAFNEADVDALAALYTPDAVNHQVAEDPIQGKQAIRAMFETTFANGSLRCVPENIFEDGDWAILEWIDPQGLRGCGFFKVKDGLICLQRGYWDKLSFRRLHGRGEV